MRAHLSLLLALVLPLLPCFSLLAMVRFSSSPSSILRFQAQPKLGPLLVTLVSGRLTESLESVEDLETGEKGRKVELEVSRTYETDWNQEKEAFLSSLTVSVKMVVMSALWL